MSTVILRHAPQAFPNLAVTPLIPTFAALIENIDLARKQSEHTIAMIPEALVEHKLLVFRGQRIAPQQQRDFAARFGPLHVHPLLNHDDDLKEIIVLNYDRSRPPEKDDWHTDVTFIETPPLGSILYGAVIPETGGDTLFADLAAAYAALSEPVRSLLDGLRATHDFQKSFRQHLLWPRQHQVEQCAQEQPAGQPSCGAHAPRIRHQEPVRERGVHYRDRRPPCR
jgi:taurine dioxygenase